MYYISIFYFKKIAFIFYCHAQIYELGNDLFLTFHSLTIHPCFLIHLNTIFL